MSADFLQNGYIVAPHFIEPLMASLLYDILLLRVWRGEGRQDDHIPTAASFWGDPTIDAFMALMAEPIGRRVGHPLLPTYGYARIYRRGDRLLPHRDREACQVTASIHLGSSGGTPPPLRFEPDIAVHQASGDAVIFLGDQLTHWRDTFEGETFGQIFVNYVYADGARAEWLYDRRQGVFPGDWLTRPRQR